MTICPIALAVGCEKCPAFKFCPLTYVLGDQQEESSPTAKEEVIPEKKKPLTKDERLALIKESAKKKSVGKIDWLLEKENNRWGLSGKSAKMSLLNG